MKHSQNEENIKELLDALAELTYQFKHSNAQAPRLSARIKRLFEIISSGDIKTIKTIASRKAKRLLGRSDTEDHDPKSQLPSQEYDYFSNEQIAVYTALFGNYDEIRDPICKPDNIDYFILTDQQIPAESKWQSMDIHEFVPAEYLSDPVMANRWCKMHPHLLFPDHNISIYVDSNYLITSDLTALVNLMHEYPVAMFRHKKRDCVYDEFKACVEQKKDKIERLRAHKEVLLEKGIPEHFGLLEAPLIVRRHHEAESIRLMDAWWSVFCRGCHRDQIALVEALWDLGIAPETIATLGDDFRKCDLFITFFHS